MALRSRRQTRSHTRGLAWRALQAAQHMHSSAAAGLKVSEAELARLKANNAQLKQVRARVAPTHSVHLNPRALLLLFAVLNPDVLHLCLSQDVEKVNGQVTAIGEEETQEQEAFIAACAKLREETRYALLHLCLRPPCQAAAPLTRSSITALMRVHCRSLCRMLEA